MTDTTVAQLEADVVQFIADVKTARDSAAQQIAELQAQVAKLMATAQSAATGEVAVTQDVLNSLDALVKGADAAVAAVPTGVGPQDRGESPAGSGTPTAAVPAPETTSAGTALGTVGGAPATDPGVLAAGAEIAASTPGT